MIKRTTYQDLLLYAYNETGLHDSDRIQRSIDGDPLLKKEYDELFDIIQVLDSAKPSVPGESLKKITTFLSI